MCSVRHKHQVSFKVDGAWGVQSTELLSVADTKTRIEYDDASAIYSQRRRSSKRAKLRKVVTRGAVGASVSLRACNWLLCCAI